MSRSTIAIVAGALNEAERLPEFLRCHAWADEIVVMDSGSTDGTLDICRQAGCRVIPRDHKGNHNERFRYVLAQISSDWVFVVDPDECITEGLKTEIVAVLEQGTAHSAFRNRRVNFFMSHALRSKAFHDDTLKFFRREMVDLVGSGYHEEIKVNGSIGRFSGEVHHFPHTHIHWMIAKHNYISEFDKAGYLKARGVLSHGQFMRFVLVRPLKTFFKTYIKKGGYKDGVYGFTFALITWAQDVLKICKYWEAYIEKNPRVLAQDKIPDPWRQRS